jgi:hypothetical protein
MRRVHATQCTINIAVDEDEQRGANDNQRTTANDDDDVWLLLRPPIA